MAKSKQKKQEELEQFAERLQKAKSVLFAGFEKVTVTDLEILRRQLRAESSELIVMKKTLLTKVLADRQISGVNLDTFTGNIAVALGYQDEVAPAKLWTVFSKKREDVAVFGGLLGTQVLSVAEVTALATLPSREELLAKVVGSLKAPVTNVVGVLAGILRSTVGVLKAIADQKQAAS